MSEVFRSSVFAAKEETTEGTLITPTAGDYIPIRDGFSFSGDIEVVDSDEYQSDIGPSKSYIGKENPKGSLPKFFRHSGTEGTAPEYSIMIKSAFGNQATNATEYNTYSGGTAGTASVRGAIPMNASQEGNYTVGQGILIKDSTNGYSVRNVYAADGTNGRLDLNFNITTAAGTGLGLGKAIFFYPTTGTNLPTYSAYHYQASSSAAFSQAIAGTRTTNMAINFPANGLAEINFDFEGISHYFNPITIDATNNYIDFGDGTSTYEPVLSSDVYNPHELAREIATKMNAQSSDTITCTYSDSTGKFTPVSAGGTFELLWSSGTNTAVTVGESIGFAVAADDTGATSYASDSAISFDPSVTPTYDSGDSVMVRASNLLIGGYNDDTCRAVTNATFTISTPKTDFLSICATSGIDSSITNERVCTFTCNMKLSKYDAGLYDKFKNNTTTSIMFTSGAKSGGNWTEGTVINLYMANATITAHPIAESDGVVIIALEAKGFVNSTHKDCYLNFL